VRGNGNVLFLATGIGKAQINELDVVVLDHFQNVGDRHVLSPNYLKVCKIMTSNSGFLLLGGKLAGSMPGKNLKKALCHNWL
jgi:hypothetical protein